MPFKHDRRSNPLFKDIRIPDILNP